MKIEIQNLGPIHHFEFDLEKDLHLLYGENNVGKSFAVNVVYCILEAFLQDGEWRSQLDHSEYNAYKEDVFNSIKNTSKYNELNSKVINKIKFAPDSIDIESEFKSALNYLISKTLIKRINSNIDKTYFGKLKNYLNDEIGEIKIGTSFIQLFLQYDQNEGFILFNINMLHKDFGSKIEGYKIDDGFNYSIGNISENGKISEDRFCFEMAMGIYYSVAKSPKIGDVFILPASRSGLNVLQNNVGYIFAKLSGDFRNRPNFPKPILDYFENLNSINLQNKDDAFVKIIQAVEKLFGGKISIDSDSKKIFYLPKENDETIPIENAASMISELAPFVLHLLFLINRRPDKNGNKPPLLIIEEPEAHLHPKAQVQLMEIFVELTYDVKVILTSHSNYMFNKLSNLLLKKEIGHEIVKVYHMEMTDKGSIVKGDMKATSEGIEDHNFSDVAEQLYNERLQSYHAFNEEEGHAYKRTPKE